MMVANIFNYRHKAIVYSVRIGAVQNMTHQFMHLYINSKLQPNALIHYNLALTTFSFAWIKSFNTAPFPILQLTASPQS